MHHNHSLFTQSAVSGSACCLFKIVIIIILQDIICQLQLICGRHGDCSREVLHMCLLFDFLSDHYRSISR